MLIKTQKMKFSMHLKQKGAYLWERQPHMARTVSMHHLQAVNHQAHLNVVLNLLHRTALCDDSFDNLHGELAQNSAEAVQVIAKR